MEESSKRGLLGKIFKTNKIKEHEYFSMSQQKINSESMHSGLGKPKVGSLDSSGSSSAYSNKESTTSSAAAIGTGNISLCQAIFAP